MSYINSFVAVVPNFTGKLVVVDQYAIANYPFLPSILINWKDL